MNHVDTTNQQNVQSKDKKKTIIIVLLVTLIVLFILSLTILVIRLGNFLSNGTDIFFIEPKEPEFVVQDDKVIWTDDTEIDIFSVQSVNGEGQITVLSGTGDKIIAPGTKGYYKFNFQNIGNIAIDCSCLINARFDSDSVISVDELPIVVRLKDYKGNYLIGNEDSWEQIDVVNNFLDEQTIGKNSYVFYELEWCWEFESGNDAIDTLLGNVSSNGTAKLVLELSAQAVQSENMEAVGGLTINANDPRTGGHIVPLPYILLNLLILIVLVILLVLAKKKRGLESKILKDTITESVSNITEE